MEIEYKPEPGERWIPYYIGEKPIPPGVKTDSGSITYKTLVHCPCCGGTNILERPPRGVLGTLKGTVMGNLGIYCNDCKKTIGIINEWKYSPYSIPGIWSDKELEDYRVYLTMSRMDEIKEDFGGFKTDDGMKIHKTKSGKYIVVEGIV